MDKATNDPITREDLYALVWAEPLGKIAVRYGVTSGDVTKACAALIVPKPEQGHWTKVDLAKADLAPPLPEPTSDQPLTWTFSPKPVSLATRKPRAKSNSIRKRQMKGLSGDAEHPLLNGARKHITTSRYYTDADYYKPDKKLLVDIFVSKTGLDKALHFANALFLALEAKSYSVVIAPHDDRRFYRMKVDIREVIPKKERERYWDGGSWSPLRPTIVAIEGVEFGLTLFEMSEQVLMRYVNGDYIRDSEYVPPKKNKYFIDRSWTTNKDFASGRFCLQAYSQEGWSHQWRETKERDLLTQIPEIIKGLEGSVNEVQRLIQEAQRKKEEWRLKREEEERLEIIEYEKRRAANAFATSKKNLLETVERWGAVMRLEQFFQEAQVRIAALPLDQQEKLTKQLNSARDLIGTLNPLDYLLEWKSPRERLGITDDDDEYDEDNGIPQDQ